MDCGVPESASDGCWQHNGEACFGGIEGVVRSFRNGNGGREVVHQSYNHHHLYLPSAFFNLFLLSLPISSHNPSQR